VARKVYDPVLFSPDNHSSCTNDEPVATERGRKKKEGIERRKRSVSTEPGCYNVLYWCKRFYEL